MSRPKKIDRAPHNPGPREHHLDGVAEELSADDSIDPRIYFDRRTRPNVDRKLQRLCSEVRNVLDTALGMGMRDELLQGASILSAEAVPGTYRIRLTVGIAGHGDSTVLELAHGHLLAAMPFLRSEIARCLNPRRIPDLEFVVQTMDA